jgi:ABC-type branched-subunit amino acid transport system substrate-binding protein
MRRRTSLLAGTIAGASLMLGHGVYAADPVKFGILTGMTGDYGPWGQAGLAAAQIAADEINAAGGINGAQLELVVADNKSSVEGGISGWKRLVEVEGVTAIGGTESDAALALLQDAAAAKVPIMCPACGTPQLKTKGGGYVWRLTGGDDDLGVIMAQEALEKTKSISMITESGLDATTGITKVFGGAYKAGGGTIAADITVNADAASFRSELDKAVKASDQVFVSTGLEVGMRLLTEYQRRGYSGNLYVIPEMIADEVSKFGNGKYDGHIFGVAPAYDKANPAYTKLAESYKAKTGKDPSPAMYEPNYYDQIILLALAATAAGENTGEGMRNNLGKVSGPPGVQVTSFADGVKELKAGHDIDYVGASGPIDFNEFGNVDSHYSEVTPKGGSWTEVKTITLDTELRPAD